MMKLSIFTLLSLLFTPSFGKAPPYEAVIYTGFTAYCDDGLTTNSSCWDAAGWFLGNSSIGFNLRFLNQTQLLETDLSGVDLYVQPGGGDANTPPWDAVWHDMEPLAPKIKTFVADGGRYVGFCQGAYLAGSFSDTSSIKGFNMLPSDIIVDEELTQPGSQAFGNYDDVIIQLNYTLADGTTLVNQSVFFQDGAVLLASESDDCSPNLEVLGSYYADGDYAIGLMAYEKGVVGVSGPHVEADRSFWDADGFTNPDNLTDPTNGYRIGIDFLKQLMAANSSSIREKAENYCDVGDSISVSSGAGTCKA